MGPDYDDGDGFGDSVGDFGGGSGDGSWKGASGVFPEADGCGLLGVFGLSLPDGFGFGR